MTKFNKGIIYASLGSFWWGVIGVLYFKFISYVNPFEVVSHRVIWTVFSLFITIFISGKIKFFFLMLHFMIKNYITIFFSGLLIFINWAVWIYAISINQLVEASFGYYIFPILSVFFEIFFLKNLNFRKNFNFNNFYSIIYMMFF